MVRFLCGALLALSLRSAAYTPNALNQYSSRTVPSAIDILGIAKTDASVTVNSQPAYRKGEFYHKAVTVANGSAAVNQPVTVSATSGTTVNIAGAVFVPPASETFGHDLDGNLTSDSRWTYTWDAENRLVKLVGKVAGVQPTQLDFEYDWRGRRIGKTVTTSGVASTNKYLYDGWNLVAELDGSDVLQRTYIWGLDLSGTLDGAGGVGGLLFVKPASSGVAQFASYDGNGNITALVDASNGSVSAEYEFGPLGELLHLTGAMGKANPFRFSTKYHDDEADFLYYGHRYYNLSTGRWLSRDPFKEKGGSNLYAFVSNNPNAYDVLGLWKEVTGGTASQKKAVVSAEELALQGAIEVRNLLEQRVSTTAAFQSLYPALFRVRDTSSAYNPVGFFGTWYGGVTGGFKNIADKIKENSVTAFICCANEFPECGNCEGNLAFTRFGDTRIFFCSGFFSLDQRVKAATVVHEYGHLVLGAQDGQPSGNYALAWPTLPQYVQHYQLFIESGYNKSMTITFKNLVEPIARASGFIE